jgi:hypothetical protein
MQKTFASDKVNVSPIHIAQKMIKEEGIKGLYKGYIFYK